MYKYTIVHSTDTETFIVFFIFYINTHQLCMKTYLRKHLIFYSVIDTNSI